MGFSESTRYVKSHGLQGDPSDVWKTLPTVYIFFMKADSVVQWTLDTQMEAPPTQQNNTNKTQPAVKRAPSQNRQMHLKSIKPLLNWKNKQA